MISKEPELFEGKDASLEAFRTLADVLDGLGELKVEEKKTSLHVVAGNAAFLGIQARKLGLRLTIVLDRSLTSPRIVKSEQVSRSRYHNELDFNADQVVDEELRGWIVEAYKLQSKGDRS